MNISTWNCTFHLVLVCISLSLGPGLGLGPIQCECTISFVMGVYEKKLSNVLKISENSNIHILVHVYCDVSRSIKDLKNNFSDTHCKTKSGFSLNFENNKYIFPDVSTARIDIFIY